MSSLRARVSEGKSGEISGIVMLRPFAIHEPSSVQEAVGLLVDLGQESRIYAGGTELLIIMKEGLARFEHLINIKAVPDLDKVEFRDGWLRIGACTTHRMVEDSNVVREHHPGIAEVARGVANIRVRNVGTIGGNLCFADPHSDPATVLLVCDAVVEISGLKGSRTLPIGEFIQGPLETALDDTEILTRINVPSLGHGVKVSYIKFGCYERPTIGVACRLQLEDGGVVRGVRFALGSVGETPKCVTGLDDLFLGKDMMEAVALMPEAAESAYEQVKPVSDFHGSMDYKRQLIRVFLERAFLAACGRN